MSPLSPLKAVVHRLGGLYCKAVTRREFLTQRFVGINERPVEFRFVFEQLSKIWPTSVLDVGTGMTALPHLMRNCGFVVTAIDNIKDYWRGGMSNRHYYVINDDITNTKLNKKFDFITCVSVLEHIKNHSQAVKSMFDLLNPNGHLILSFPYNENSYVDNVYRLPGSVGEHRFPFVTQVYSRKELSSWLSENHARIIEQEYWQFFSGKYWTLGERLCPPLKANKNEKHQISCMLLQKY
jgi:SAM-dependent methyltransferase